MDGEYYKDVCGFRNGVKEVIMLEEFFSKLSATPDNYGLIHYDFEQDNIFYDEAASQYSVIDFDDSMYHWFAVDVERSINSFKDELPEELQEQAVNRFLNGYRSVMCLDESMLALIPVFRRYANLFSYARGLRSIHEKWDNEPDWMIELRKNMQATDEESKYFGEEIAT